MEHCERITVRRIAVTPLIGNWIITGHYELALAGIVYTAISDGLDGLLARCLRLQTIVGSYLDPAADKLVISTTSVCLAAKGIIPTGFATLMIGRDMDLIGGWLRQRMLDQLSKEEQEFFKFPNLNHFSFRRLTLRCRSALVSPEFFTQPSGALLT